MSTDFYNNLNWILFASFGAIVLLSAYIQYRFLKRLDQKHSEYFKSIGSPTMLPATWNEKITSSVLDFKLLFNKLPPDVSSDPTINKLGKWERVAMIVALIIWVAGLFVAPRYRP